MTELRNLDTDAFVLLQRLRQASIDDGIADHHEFPLRTAQGFAMGELKATSWQKKKEYLYRLYYGQPDEPANMVVGATLAQKRIHGSRTATTAAQDADIRKAESAFRSWLKAHPPLR